MNSVEVAYQEALDYLYSFVDYSLTRNLRNAAVNFNLDRMRRMMELLGDPQKTYKTIHVAGTKGKGSTSAMIANALQMQGYKVGFYSSPHLEDYVERIQVDRIPISHEELTELINSMKPFIAQVPEITTFELTTALGFLYFSRKGVDIAVIEVGLGGRLDATNILDPLVSVITSLSYDHTSVLGDTLAQIAGEKAGIVKPGRDVVISPQKDEALKVVEKIAKERNAPLTLVGREYCFTELTHTLKNQTLAIWPASEQTLADAFIEKRSNEWQPTQLEIPLLGRHQVENAATAYVTLQIARKRGLEITENAIKKGFSTVWWPGRFEILQTSPFVIVDSAHNRDSALKLRLALDDYLPGVPVILVFGASEDKDIQGMFTELLPRVKKVIATQSVHPRALDPEKLVELAHTFGCAAQAVVPISDALKTAIEQANGKDAIVITGSLFVAAAIRSTWRERIDHTLA
jgi:dihydrofolate synthase/folylpolyglutamate synthase